MSTTPLSDAVSDAASEAASASLRALIAHNDEINKRAVDAIAKHEQSQKANSSKNANAALQPRKSAEHSSAATQATQVGKPRGCAKCGRKAAQQ
jgi:hypothetical protein